MTFTHSFDYRLEREDAAKARARRMMPALGTKDHFALTDAIDKGDGGDIEVMCDRIRDSKDYTQFIGMIRER